MSDDRCFCNAVWKKKGVWREDELSGREREAADERVEEKRKTKRGTPAGKRADIAGVFTWIDHASGSLSLVFPPYLKTPPCPVKVTSVTSPLVLRSSPLHRFGCEHFPIGPDSGTNDATMVRRSGVNYLCI